jgi:hypothetical protein
MNWNLHLLKIFEKGMAAFHAGKNRNENPYSGHITGFNRQRRLYWDKGFEQEMMIASDQRIFNKGLKENPEGFASLNK